MADRSLDRGGMVIENTTPHVKLEDINSYDGRDELFMLLDHLMPSLGGPRYFVRFLQLRATTREVVHEEYERFLTPIIAYSVFDEGVERYYLIFCGPRTGHTWSNEQEMKDAVMAWIPIVLRDEYYQGGWLSMLDYDLRNGLVCMEVPYSMLRSS